MNDRFVAVFWYFLITLLLTPDVSLATVLVAISTKDAVIIAADSKETQFDGKSAVASKIFQVGDIVYALSGPADKRKSDAEIERIIRSSSTIKIAATQMEALLPELFEELFSEIQIDHPGVFQDNLNKIKVGNDRLATVLMAAVEQGEPVLVAVNFVASLDAGGKIRIRAEIVTEGNLFTVGDIAAYKAQHGFPWHVPLAEIPGCLVQLALDAGHPRIGPPVEVVRIDKTGVTKQRRPFKAAETLSGCFQPFEVRRHR